MTSNSVIIRKLSIDEWEKFKNIRLRSVKLEPIAFGSIYLQESQRTKEEWIEKLKAKDRNWIFAEDGKSLIGIIGSLQNYHNVGKHIAYIVAFFVEPEYRRKGIGKKLLLSMIAKLQQNPEIQSIRLGVTVTLDESIQFYEHLGFKIIDRKTNEVQVDNAYYDEYQMELQHAK